MTNTDKKIKKPDFPLFPVVAAGLILIAGGILWIKFKPKPPTEKAFVEPKEFIIGELAPLTGKEAALGTHFHNGIVLAVEEASPAGVNGKTIRIVQEDTAGSKEGASRAAIKLIHEGKASVLMGEIENTRTIAAAEVAQRMRVPMVSPVSTAPRVTDTGNYIFRTSFLDRIQGFAMATFALDHLKAKSAVLFHDIKSDYSMGIDTFFEEEFARRGGKILVPHLTYKTGEKDYKAQLKKVKAAKPDVFFIPGEPGDVGLIAQQAKNMGITAKLLGTDSWENSKLTEVGGLSILGAYFSTHYSNEIPKPLVQDFVRRYKEKFKEAPHPYAALSYHATQMVLTAAKASPDLHPKSLRDAMGLIKNFDGVTGALSLDNRRNAVKPIVVLQVNSKQKFGYITTIPPQN